MSEYSKPRLHKPFIGKHHCSICGYDHDDEIAIKEHIEKTHPNRKQILQNRYNELRGLG